MQEIVINDDYGGFSLSVEAIHEYAKRKGFEVYFYIQTKYSSEEPERIDGYIKIGTETEAKRRCVYAILKDLGDKINDLPSEDALWFDEDIKRDDKDLVRIVKEMGEKANGTCAHLKVVEIPDDVKWEIAEYDGSEHVAEVHRTWY